MSIGIYPSEAWTRTGNEITVRDLVAILRDLDQDAMVLIGESPMLGWMTTCHDGEIVLR